MGEKKAGVAIFTGAAAVGVAVLSIGAVLVRRRRQRQPDREDGWQVVRRAVTVDRPVEAVIGFWSDRERLDRTLRERATLEQVAPDRWRCVATDREDGGTEWRAEITVTGPGRLRWRVEGEPVPQEGTVELVPAPMDRGTEIRTELRYRRGGRLARLFDLAIGNEPDLRLRSTLRRVKSLIECGEVVTTQGDPSGRGRAAEKITDVVREKLTAGGRA